MQNAYARIRLAEWGRWNRDNIRGYPRQSAVVGEYGGRSTIDTSAEPPHIAYVGLIVRQMAVEPRKVIIVHYTQTGIAEDKAIRIGVALRAYRRLLREGQDHVSIELNYEDIAMGTCASVIKMASCR